jgi:hypothetical protein
MYFSSSGGTNVGEVIKNFVVGGLVENFDVVFFRKSWFSVL